MELRGIPLVQVAKPSDTRRTNSVSETRLDPELVAQSTEHGRGQRRHNPGDADQVEDVEDFEVVEVSDPETDQPQTDGHNHVDVLA